MCFERGFLCFSSVRGLYDVKICMTWGLTNPSSSACMPLLVYDRNNVINEKVLNNHTNKFAIKLFTCFRKYYLVKYKPLIYLLIS